MHKRSIEPRIIRAGQAQIYCGMCDRVFNAEIRPYLTEIRIGVQGVGFDRFEMDEVLNDYIDRYGRAPSKAKENDKCKKERNQARVYTKGAVCGTLISASVDAEYAKALARATGKMRKST